MLDSHCHIAGEEFAADLDAVAARAAAAGVRTALCILEAEDEPELSRAAQVRAAWPGVRFATGVHPHHAAKFAGNLPGLLETVGVAEIAILAALITHHRDVAIEQALDHRAIGRRFADDAVGRGGGGALPFGRNGRGHVPREGILFPTPGEIADAGLRPRTVSGVDVVGAAPQWIGGSGDPRLGVLFVFEVPGLAPGGGPARWRNP